MAENAAFARPVLVPQGSLEAYMAWAQSLPLLSQDEEQAFGVATFENNCAESAKALIMAHLRYVIFVAKKYQGYGLALADLIQEGNIGLIKAVKRFDPSAGVRLVSYAVYWIKAEIHEFILRNWRIVRIATTKAQRKLFFKLRSTLQFDRAVTADEAKEIASQLDVSDQDVFDMQKRLQYDCSLDTPSSSDDESREPMLDRLIGSHDLDQIEQREQQVQQKALMSALSSLPPRLLTIIQERYLSEEKTTLDVLAKRIGVSIERIRQLEKQALTKLKGLLSPEPA